MRVYVGVTGKSVCACVSGSEKKIRVYEAMADFSVSRERKRERASGFIRITYAAEGGSLHV